MITQCCIHELYVQGKAEQAAVDLAKTFERRKCNHRVAIAGDDCLADVVGTSFHSPASRAIVYNVSNLVGGTNKHRYVIATQSAPLRNKLRNIPAVPIVHMNRSVMILEPMSDATVDTKKSVRIRFSQYSHYSTSNC